MVAKNWSNTPVYRNRKYENLVELLCTKKNDFSGRSIFETNKDLMIFGAMLGYSKSKREKLEKDPVQIFMSVYQNDEKDGYIYLLGLLEKEDVKVLKDENLSSAIDLYQEYCNGGLSIIKSWLDDHPEDIDGIDTLHDKIFEQISAISSSNIRRGGLADVEF